ncbi:monovalent cation/H+ antiporter subunit E [Saliphagus sp. GCM10025334]
MAADRLLVPLSESSTVRQTVAYAVQSSLESASGPGELVCHLVVAVPFEADVPEERAELEAAEGLLERAATWVGEDTEDVDATVTVETAIIGADEYLFGPKDYADAFAAYAEAHDLNRLVLDPEYQPGATAPLLQPLERELTRIDLPFDEAPVDRPAQHARFVSTGGWRRFFGLFGISFIFYLVLGDPTYWFDLVTGVAVAGIVSLTLSHVTFIREPSITRGPVLLVRFLLYIPYLLYEIVKANVAVSIAILRPSMPIEPTLTRVDARVKSGLPLLALANSITLTPGTLTVRANDQSLIVHTLIPAAQDDLFDGGLERAIRFVFYGRGSAAIASPRERGDAEVVYPESALDADADADTNADPDSNSDSNSRSSTERGDER